jgi:tetratricopeptide (TPR) repeat protein
VYITEGDHLYLVQSMDSILTKDIQHLRTSARVFGIDHLTTYRIMAYLSSALCVQKRLPEAEAEARLSKRGLKRYIETCRGDQWKEASETLLLAEISLARILGDGEQYEEALEIQKMVADSLADFGTDKPRSLTVAHDLAITLTIAGRFEEALKVSQEVLDSYNQVYGPDHPRTGHIVLNLAKIYTTQLEFAQGEIYSKRALDCFQEQSGNNLSETVGCLGYLASYFEGQGQFSMALKYFEDAHARMVANFGPENEGTQLWGDDVERLRDLVRHYPPAVTGSHSGPEPTRSHSDGKVYPDTNSAQRHLYLNHSNYPRSSVAKAANRPFEDYTSDSYYVAGANFSRTHPWLHSEATTKQFTTQGSLERTRRKENGSLEGE